MKRLLPLLAVLGACSGNGAPAPNGGAPGADLSGFPVTRLNVGAVEFELWIARSPAQQAQGLMNATASQLAPLPDGTPRGMLFAFSREQILSFFMRDTFVALDLAYARADGTIVEVFELIPLSEALVVSGQPAQYALEAPAGTFLAQGIGPGTVIDVTSLP